MWPTRSPDAEADSPAISPKKTPRRVLGELTPNTQFTRLNALNDAKSPTKHGYMQSSLKVQQALRPAVKLDQDENTEARTAALSRKRSYSAIVSPERTDATRSPAKRREVMPLQTVSPAALRSPLPPPIVIETADEDTDEDEAETIEHSTETMVAPAELINATQGTTGSFSSLIDYNPDHASDRSEQASVSPPSSRTSSIPVTSRVELLKLRLRMAMYKINTNQTLVPFAQLEQPHKRTIPLSPTEEEQGDEMAQALTHPSKILDNIVITGGPIGKLLSGPVFAPTAFSAKFVNGPGASASPSRKVLDTRHLTPATSPTRLSRFDETDLTSSVVKDHAASGLLELAQSK